MVASILAQTYEIANISQIHVRPFFAMPLAMKAMKATKKASIEGSGAAPMKAMKAMKATTKAAAPAPMKAMKVMKARTFIL